MGLAGVERGYGEKTRMVDVVSLVVSRVDVWFVGHQV